MNTDVKTLHSTFAASRWLGCLLMMILAGCNVIGAVHYAAVGPPRQPALFELKQVPTVVLVENYEAPSVGILDSDRLAMLLTRELQNNTTIELVPSERVAQLREQQRQAFSRMRISEIGKAVGAEQVIYVNLVRSEVEQTAGLLKASVAARVKVVDATSGRLLWPPDSAEGYPVSHETPMVRPDEKVTHQTIRAEMIDTMAVRISRLFHSWKPEYIGEI